MKYLIMAGCCFGAAYFLFTEFHWHECGRHSYFMHVSSARSSCGSMDRSPSVWLKMLASAQADFHANDRDGNGRKDFWRRDVAGLYTVRDASGAPIRLIQLAAAAADDRPASQEIESYAARRPVSGYWLRALPHAGEKVPGPNRFAACCFPADYPKTGRLTFILDENNTLYKRDLGRPGGIEVFPDDAELTALWSKLG